MTNLQVRRIPGESNTWLFYAERQEDEQVVEDVVDQITFPATVTTAAHAIAAREAILPELAADFIPPPTQADYSNAIQQHLDATARGRGYDSIQTAVSYRDDPNPQFAAEGAALFQWRSAVWTAATAMLAAVDPQNPPSVADVIDTLPDFVWP